jgi:hypothetical protein
LAVAPYEEEEPIEMSFPAEVEEEPFEVLHQNQLSSDQAHIMPQLFGWLAPDDQKERARYLTDLTRPRANRARGYFGPAAGIVEGLVPGEAAGEDEKPPTTP